MSICENHFRELLSRVLLAGGHAPLESMRVSYAALYNKCAFVGVSRRAILDVSKFILYVSAYCEAVFV